MSEVISFRLDKNNPREAQALAVLLWHLECGYTVRQILTEALLEYHQDDKSYDLHAQIAEVLSVMRQVGHQVERIQKISNEAIYSREENHTTLSDTFVLSVKSAAKPGITFKDGSQDGM